MRLIDADAMHDYVVDVYGGNGDNTVVWYGDIVEFIDSSPTVDAVHVCRCEECRWHEDEVPGMVWCPNVIGSWVRNDWFCADGERKGGDE